MNVAEDLDEQMPTRPRRYRWPECRCLDRARGGCSCDDDGTVYGAGVAERDAHEDSGPPRRT